MPAPWFRFFPQDFLGDTKVQMLSNSEKGMLVVLWCHCAQRGQIPIDAAKIARLVGVTPATMKKVLPSLLPFFEQEGGFIYSPRLRREQMEYEEYLQKQAEKGVKSAQSRLDKYGTKKPLPHSDEANHGSQVGSGSGSDDGSQVGSELPEPGPEPRSELPYPYPQPINNSPLPPQGAPATPTAPQAAAKAERKRRPKRTRDPMPLNRIGGIPLEAFEEAAACWPVEITGFNDRTRRNETRRIERGNLHTAQKNFLALIEEGAATAQELYACAFVACSQWRREGYLWVPHLSTFYGPEKETWTAFLPAAREALAKLQPVEVSA